MRSTFYLILVLSGVISSCSSNDNQPKVIWLSGFQVTCGDQNLKENCLYINPTEDMAVGKWQIDSSKLYNFQISKDSLVKIEIMDQISEEKDKNSDPKYIIKILEKRFDHRPNLSKQWHLESIFNNSVSIDEKPVMTIDLAEMRIYGSTGCNNFTGNILNLGLESIELSELANTMKLCPEENIETDFLKALNQVRNYKIDLNNLYFEDSNGDNILQFKSRTSDVTRIHDIWAAVRIEGFPINRMVTVPRLEINTTEMKIYGNDGCNEYFGRISNLKDSEMSFDNIGSSRKICENMEVTSRYNDAIRKVRSYSFEDRILILKDENNNEVLAFIKID